MPITADEFRRLALSFPDTIESEHMGHPDFRTNGKIFATLPYDGHGMVKLSPTDQTRFVDPETETFMPARGAWGRQGSTIVNLKLVSKSALQDAMRKAWENIASAGKPKARTRSR